MEKMKMKMINSSNSSSVILNGLRRHNDKKRDDDDDDDGGVRLPGFRFHPTDEELVGFYLRRKVEKKTLVIDLIKQIDIYKYDPWELPKITTIGDKEWYFFCIRERKYRNSIRPNRVTGSGFWKATGIDKPIYSVDAEAPTTTDRSNECIGLKKSLVFYIGNAGKGTKTDWMMHEFRLSVAATSNGNFSKSSSRAIPQEAEIWTLCRIFKRNISIKQKYLPDCRKITSSSHSCSTETDNTNREKPGTSSIVQQNGKKPIILDHHMDEIRNCSFSGMLSSIAQEPFEVHIQDFTNPNGNASNRDGNWDEIVNMVELDPNLMYD